MNLDEITEAQWSESVGRFWAWVMDEPGGTPPTTEHAAETRRALTAALDIMTEVTRDDDT